MNTVFKSVPELCNLVIVAGLFFLIFGLFAVNAFKGKFRICQALSDGELDYHDVLGSRIARRRSVGMPASIRFPMRFCSRSAKQN